jgi:electron transport complex protein RnfG
MKQLFPLAFALTAIAAIAAFGLAMVFQVTEEPIRAAETLKRVQAVDSVLKGVVYENSPVPFPGDESFINTQMVNAAKANDQEKLTEICGDSMIAFLESPVTDEAKITASDWYKFGDYWYFVARDSSGAVLGYAARVFSDQGYSGYVETFVGIDISGKVIGMQVTDHRETPGLGSKINDPDFKEQFIGNSLETHEFEVTKTGEPNRINAIAGATISTRAVTNPIRIGLQLIEKHKDEIANSKAVTEGEGQ